jgi:hypothetical protein
MTVRSGRLTMVIAVLVAGVLGGCAASQNPLGPESEAVSEPRLTGSWQYVGEKSGGWDYLHVFRDGEGRGIEIVAINSTEKAWAVLVGYLTAVGERHFVNLRVTEAAAAVEADLDKQQYPATHPYSFVAIRFDGSDGLAVAYPIEQLHAAVTAGRLAGTTIGDYDVLITDTSANIAALLGGLSEDDLFKDPLLYRRIPAPSP